MKTFRDYAEFNEKLLEGFTIAEVFSSGPNNEDGLVIELERRITGGVIGIDIEFNPDPEEGQTHLMFSGEYVKSMDQEEGDGA